MIETIPPVLVGWMGPLIIILPFTLLVRHWLLHPWRLAAFVYTISIFTGIFFDITQDISDEGSAAIAGIYAPLIYCLLFSLSSVFYRYFIRQGLVNIDPERVNLLEKGLLSLGGLVSGILIGGVIGLLLGAIVTFLFLAYVNFKLLFEVGFYMADYLVDFILEGGIYLFGVLGAISGGIMGAKSSNAH